MDDGRSPGVEEEEAAQDLSAPAANHLRFRPETTHVTRERRREGEGERQMSVIGTVIHDPCLCIHVCIYTYMHMCICECTCTCT